MRSIVSFDSTMMGSERIFSCAEVGPLGKVITY